MFVGISGLGFLGWGTRALGRRDGVRDGWGFIGSGFVGVGSRFVARVSEVGVRRVARRFRLGVR